MEAVMKGGGMGTFKDYFFKEAKPFTSKREVNWFKVKLFSSILMFLLIVVLLILPTGQETNEEFHQKAETGSLGTAKVSDSDPTQETLKQIQQSQAGMRQVHGSLDYLYRRDTAIGTNGRNRASPDRNSSMIITRGGSGSKNQLSVGTRISVKLSTGINVTNRPMPIIGIVSKDVFSESGIAIPSGSKVLGDVTLDEEIERASIAWRSIIMPDGRERPFSALGLGRDGELGVSGKFHSNGVRNAAGQTITRFVGAYASGSINTGAFGANKGGHVNGLRNAIAQTATDQANSMGEDMQKSRKWIELSSGMDTFAVLNQPFLFRDVGATYGR